MSGPFPIDVGWRQPSMKGLERVCRPERAQEVKSAVRKCESGEEQNRALRSVPADYAKSWAVRQPQRAAMSSGTDSVRSEPVYALASSGKGMRNEAAAGSVRSRTSLRQKRWALRCLKAWWKRPERLKKVERAMTLVMKYLRCWRAFLPIAMTILWKVSLRTRLSFVFYRGISRQARTTLVLPAA